MMKRDSKLSRLSAEKLKISVYLTLFSLPLCLSRLFLIISSLIFFAISTTELFSIENIASKVKPSFSLCSVCSRKQKCTLQFILEGRTCHMVKLPRQSVQI